MTTETAEATASGRWALWGTAAGALGLVTNVLLSRTIDYTKGPEGIVEGLSRSRYQVGAITGYLAAACVVLVAAGLSRWADRQASASIALRAAPFGLVASAGAMIAGYGVKGQLAEYLPGGSNPDNFETDGLYTFFLLDDLAGYFAWWGVTVAAGCLAWLSLRDGLLPRWLGVVAGLFAAAPLAYLLVSGFTGFSGLVAPLFLVVLGTGLALRRA
jgi:hypothetical protein